MDFNENFEAGARFCHEPTGVTGTTTGRKVSKPNPPSAFRLLLIELQLENGRTEHFPASELKRVE